MHQIIGTAVRQAAAQRLAGGASKNLQHAIQRQARIVYGKKSGSVDSADSSHVRVLSSHEMS
jgi:hypothetical protein